MLRLIILLIIGITSFSARAQSNYGYEEALIRLKNGDSIQCFLKIELNYGSKIWYKKDVTAKEVWTKASEVESMTTPTKYLENILVGKRELMMTRMSNGRATLFMHVTLNEGAPRSFGGGTTQLYRAPTLIYVIRKDSNEFEIKDKNFREALAALMFECASVVQKLRKKTYKFDEVPVAVDEYNACQ